MNALVKHIEGMNAKTQEWVDAGPDRWASMLTTDVEHWAEYGISTPAELDRYLSEQDLYELVAQSATKSYARVVLADIKDKSDEELKAEIEYWGKESERVFEEEKAQADRAVADVEAEIQQYIEYGAGNRETALRWMTQDETFHHSQDVEGFVYSRGILFTDFGRELVKELMEIVNFVEFEEAA